MGLLLVGVAAVAVVVCFLLFGVGVSLAGWLVFGVVTGWMVLSLTLAAVTLIIDTHGRDTPPTLGEVFRAWMVTAARMTWVPFAMAVDVMRGRGGRRPGPSA
ncbi:hypothetical protein P3T36_007809 [Kitasatospora sp. MAP12-15]|uniref:hypothetical protein n=1 Tax=unclassified Kitasatospora TaxID=2633591 RepID=UPI002475AC4F|nr:hypothetical protein [Kitasatospora sp. MAP12-44]MDH6108014.1 hypothetical protein [Kitasatospora sp. MAP12-44]